MIVRRDRSFEINSLFPNTDWYEEGNYVIDETKTENHELIEKIKRYSPFMELVIKDDKLVDIIPNEELKIEQDLLESLIPTPEEVFRAEIDLQIINILQEADLI